MRESARNELMDNKAQGTKKNLKTFLKNKYRNSPCPCNSGKKLKQCCFSLMKQIVKETNPNKKEILLQKFNTLLGDK